MYVITFADFIFVLFVAVVMGGCFLYILRSQDKQIELADKIAKAQGIERQALINLYKKRYLKEDFDGQK